MVAGTYLGNHLFGDTPLRARLFATDPFSRSLNYTICALGSSIAAFCVIGWIAERTRTQPTDTRLCCGRAHHADVVRAARAGVQRCRHQMASDPPDRARRCAGLRRRILAGRGRGRGDVATAFRDRPGRVVLPQVRWQQLSAAVYNTSLKVSHCFGSPEL